MRAPTVTGAGSGNTRVTPNSHERSRDGDTGRCVKRESNQHDHDIR